MSETRSQIIKSVYNKTSISVTGFSQESIQNPWKLPVFNVVSHKTRISYINEILQNNIKHGYQKIIIKEVEEENSDYD